MENLTQLYSLRPIDTTNLPRSSKVVTDTDPFCPPADIWQLQVDVINVFEGRVELSTFEPAYQKRIKDYYRFSATKQISSVETPIKLTNDTMDLV